MIKIQSFVFIGLKGPKPLLSNVHGVGRHTMFKYTTKLILRIFRFGWSIDQRLF